MSEKVIEFEFDRQTNDTWTMMKLLEQRIGDQLYDPEPTFDGVLNSADRQKLVVLQYELNQVIDGYIRSLIKTEETMGDLKFTTAKDFVYPGSDCQV
jgi:hypothetical protein